MKFLKSRWFWILLLSVITLAFTFLYGRYELGIGANGSEKKLIEHLRSLSMSNPEKDAERNFKAGETKYCACLGEASIPYLPNVGNEREWERIVSEKDYWIIRGTTDAIENSNHRRWISRASSYAERYNTKMKELRDGNE